jgi:hypothetical protein
MNNLIEADQFKARSSDIGALALFAYLSAENAPNSEFMIADALGPARGGHAASSPLLARS